MSYDIRTRDNTDLPAPAAVRDDPDDSAPVQDDDPAVTLTDIQPTDQVDDAIPDSVDDEPDSPVERPDEVAAPERAGEHVGTGEAPEGEEHEVPDPQEPNAEHTPVAATAQPYQVDERDMMPGDMAAQPATALWPDHTVTDLRTRWQAAQLRFVDDPTVVAADTQALIGEAMQALSMALTNRQRELDAWNQTDDHDTEQLRIVVQRYRDFFDLILGH